MMNDSYLDQYKEAWKKDQNFDKLSLSESDIKNFMQSNSKNISNLFKTGLTIDVVLKSILIISFFVLIYFFLQDTLVITINAVLIIISAAAILFQLRVYKMLPYAKNTSESIRASLNENIEFYNKKYIKSLLIGALSNAFIFLSGMMYYFYFKYGEIRPFQLDDYIVFSSAIIISFVFGAFIQFRQHNFQIRQLEVCLDEIDADTINEHTVQAQKNKRRNRMILSVIALIFGLLLFSYILMK